MPKRKKSHEYCRNRFGIFGKRRRVSSADHRCEECANGAAALAARQRRKTVDKPGDAGTHPPVHESSSRGAVSLTRSHQNSCCECQQFSAETSTPAPWLSSGSSPEHRNMSSHSESQDAFPDPTATLEEIVLAEGSPDVMMKSSCDSSSTALDYCAKSKSSERGGETDKCGRTVSSLVALTSSLKLTEGRHPACVSETLLSQKTPMDTSPVQEIMSQLPVGPQCSADHVSFGGHSKAVTHRTIRVHAGGHEPRRHVGSHRFPSRHGQRVLLSAPRVNVVHEPRDDSDDSDEGFCEPVAKRSHRLPTDGDGTAEPDEGVNVVEEVLRSPMRHRRMEYTNHSLDASLGRTCSLFWQMMSNQYGVPTKIYTVERSHTTRPCEGHSYSIPSANTNPNWDVPVFGWTQKPVVSTSPSSNISFDHHDSSVNGKSFNMDLEQHGSIFAIGNLVQDHSNVHGAIGLCLQRAVDCNKSVFVFDPQAYPNTFDDDEAGHWYQYSRAKFRFVPCQTVPVLSQNFAGLGASELTEAARLAIKAVFQKTFGAP